MQKDVLEQKKLDSVVWEFRGFRNKIGKVRCPMPDMLRLR
jgi:hypothetical protein